MNTRPNRAIERITVENTAARPLTFVLEPWANEHPIAPGERFIVEAEGPAGEEAQLYVEQSEDYLVVWAWPGADARVLRADGSVIEGWSGNRVPDIPTSGKERRDPR